MGGEATWVARDGRPEPRFASGRQYTVDRWGERPIDAAARRPSTAAPEPHARSARGLVPVLAADPAARAHVLSVVVRHVVYPAFSWNRDEATYLWQVRALRDGQIC